MDLSAARHHILERLRTELSPDLCFHSMNHTIDVYNAAVRLINHEGIRGECALIIETACLFHDAGLIHQYLQHEEISVEIAREALPGFGYTPDIIDKISNAILATKLPQGAKNQCEQVVCDADLDSLGRDDFFIQSFALKAEWEKFGIARCSLKDWFIFEMNFLENHTYYTASAIALRQEGKLRHIEEIRGVLRASSSLP